MKTLDDIKLGEGLSRADLNRLFKEIWGGVAWPSDKPGFAVILGMVREPHFDKHDIYVIDECEHSDMRNLVRQCGVFDYQYKPRRWVGDIRNTAADRFIRELNIEQIQSRKRPFGVTTTPLLDMAQPFNYILPELRRLLTHGEQQLFLKGSGAANYLSLIKEAELPMLNFGDYPAIEALTLAVLEMRNSDWQRDDTEEQTVMAGSYNPISAF